MAAMAYRVGHSNRTGLLMKIRNRWCFLHTLYIRHVGRTGLRDAKKLKLLCPFVRALSTLYTVYVSKYELTLASSSFDKHGLILTILRKRHQHTFRNYTHSLLSMSLYFYLLYLLLDSCDGNDVTPATWSSASLNMGKHLTKYHWQSC